MWKIVDSLFFLLLLLAGIYLGLEDVVATGVDPSAFWVAGLALATGSGLMIAKGLSRASANARNLLASIGLSLCGLAMLWIGYELLGFDASGGFRPDAPNGYLVLLSFAMVAPGGTIMLFLGLMGLVVGANQKREVVVPGRG